MILRSLVFSMTVLNLGCSLFGIQSEEQPQYEVVRAEGNKEIRKYKPYLVARTTVSGNFDDAQSAGFRRLADYIFGKNKRQEKISMTSPVVQGEKDASEKIAMTSPVVMSPDESGQQWSMAFMMPSKYTKDTLPEPLDNNIDIVEVAEHYRAAIKFSGFWSEGKNNEKAEELLDWLTQQKDYQITSTPKFAGYNPPWTLWFLRRNEMLVDVEISAGQP